MQVNSKSLKNKILEFYPEIRQHDIDLDIVFDSTKDSWVVILEKDKNRMFTYIEEKNAQNCLIGTKCVYLGTQIGMFIQYYCMETNSCPA